jgi:hypothetical protein
MTSMSFRRHIVAAAALALFAPFGAAYAQQDLKPLQADVDNLKQQVSRLQADLSAAQPAPPPPQSQPAPPPRRVAPQRRPGRPHTVTAPLGEAGFEARAGAAAHTSSRAEDPQH